MFSAGPRPPDLVSAGALLFHSFSLLASSMGHETESYEQSKDSWPAVPP